MVRAAETVGEGAILYPGRDPVRDSMQPAPRQPAHAEPEPGTYSRRMPLAPRPWCPHRKVRAIASRGTALGALAFVALLVAIACETPIHVAVDVDPDADLSTFQSYAWVSPEPLIGQVSGVTEGPPISPIDDKRIRKAVGAQLAAKGWREMETIEQADLVVSYGVGTEHRTEIYETPGAIGYSRYGYGYGGWYAGSTVYTKQYTEGTLTLEFFDRRTRQAAWVGWASKRLSRSEPRGEVIEAAVQKILQDFPSRQ